MMPDAFNTIAIHPHEVGDARIAGGAYQLENKMTKHEIFKGLGLPLPQKYFAATDPHRQRDRSLHPTDPAEYTNESFAAAIRRLDSMDFVIKPANCFYSAGVFIMTSDKWQQEAWSMERLQAEAWKAVTLQCDRVTRWDGTIGFDPVGPWGMVVVERVRVDEMNEGHGTANEEPFVLEPRVFVIGGRAFGVIYSHTATARSDGGPMYYAMAHAGGGAAWRGCYNASVKYSHDACVRWLSVNAPERLPTSAATIRFVHKTIQQHLPRLASESERLARTIGNGFLRVDWFADGQRIVLNEITFGSALLFRGHSTQMYSILLAGRTLNNQDVTGFKASEPALRL